MQGTKFFRGTTLIPCPWAGLSFSPNARHTSEAICIRPLGRYLHSGSSGGKFRFPLNLGRLSADDLPSLKENETLLCTIIAFHSTN